jgi:hypothetical protein
MKKTLFIIFLFCALLMFKYLFYNQVIYVETFEHQKFLVRNLPDKRQAADMLYDIKKQLLLLVNTIVNDMETDKNHKYATKYYGYVKIIQNRLPHSLIKESSHKSNYTSYTTNKGEEIVFCLRSKKTNKMHDINDLLYVAIHEIGHIGCPEIGHTDLFNEINKFLLIEAVNKGIYKYIDYINYPREYCGIDLKNTILDNNVII